MTGGGPFARLDHLGCINLTRQTQRGAFVVACHQLGQELHRGPYLALAFSGGHLDRLQRCRHRRGNPRRPIWQRQTRRRGHGTDAFVSAALASDQQPVAAHRERTVLDRLDHIVDVLIVMRRRHVGGETFEEEDPARADIGAQKAAIFLILIGAQIHQRAAIGHRERHIVLFEPPVQRACERIALGIDRLPEEIRLGLEESQHRFERCHRQRVPHEGSGKEGHRRIWEAVIAILPLTTIKGVHVLRFARDNAHRHAAAHDLAIGDQIRINAVIILRTARAEPKARDHLIKDEERACLAGHTAHLADELFGAELRTARLHRLDHHGRQLMGMGADVFHRLGRTIRKHNDILDRIARNARRQRHGLGAGFRVHGAHQHFVEIAVIIAGEHHDPVAPRAGPRQPHGRIDRL